MAYIDRFLRYVAIDTQSEDHSDQYPSTTKQFTLLNLLVEELSSLGLADVSIDKFGYVMATIPASEGCENTPVLGLLAHVDTSPEVSGAGVKARRIECYDGGDIELSHTEIIKVSDYPELKKVIGHTLITTDGNTLLGADNKAGIAAIVTAAERLMGDSSLKHGKIRIAFTPDEEVGRGVDYFDVRAFGADFAYTVDGGSEGELEYENFNAASATLEIKGHNHHPGSAKGRMINALEVALELDSLLPSNQRPQYTEGYEGFYHLCSMGGSVESASMEYIIRDHSADEFERRKVEMWSAVDFLNKRYGEGVIHLTLRDQYFNMSKMVTPHPQLIDRAVKAMKEVGVEPIITPIRGGTDGARLSFMGLPCPNLFTGAANFHSRHEYLSLTSAERCVDMLVKLAELWSVR
ncbi:MAG: peptidase T [Rikenellaceae bacterium]